MVAHSTHPIVWVPSAIFHHGPSSLIKMFGFPTHSPHAADHTSPGIEKIVSELSWQSSQVLFVSSLVQAVIVKVRIGV